MDMMCWLGAMKTIMLPFSFFFQAEDGIRDLTVTGVQTCALPIWRDFRASIALAAKYRPASSRRVLFQPESQQHRAMAEYLLCRPHRVFANPQPQFSSAPIALCRLLKA